MLRYLRTYGPIVFSVAGLSFLWPYYQRAFFRVTLFHQLGDHSLSFFGLFLMLFIAGSLALVAFYRTIEERLTSMRFSALAAAAVSVVSTVYLSGLVAPSAEGPISCLLSVFATAGYAFSLLAVSTIWMILLIRIVYSKGLFHAVSVLAASSILGFFLSPTYSASFLSMGFMPVCGILVAGICAHIGSGLIGDEQEPPSYQPLRQAPYIKTWIAPLVAYLLFAFSHAIGYSSDFGSEVHVADGQLMAATTSFSDYAVFVVFSTIILAAAVRSMRESKHFQEKATFWVASMGVSIGLFFGLFFSNILSEPSLNVPSVMAEISPCFPILLAFISLLMTYQDRLSPLQSFGLFFFAMLAVEKVLSYIVLPAVMESLGPIAADASRMIDVAIGAVSLVALLVFFVKFCQGDTLRMLFSASGAQETMASQGDREAPRRSICLALAHEHGLTKRELDILCYLSLGYSAKRIGEMLFISERTVQTHTRNIYRKIDVHTRQDVIDLVDGRLVESAV